MNAVITHFADSASGPAALGISGQAFVIQVLTFLIVFLLLKKWAFKPIIKMLNERQDTIERGVTLGEKMQAEEAKLEEEVSKQLHAARQQADTIIADAEAEVREKLQAAEDGAKKRADAMLAEAETQIKQASVRERKRLEKEIVGLVSEVSEAIIHEKVDAKKDASIIDKALKEYQSA